jgi:hypothetical protein
MQTKRPSSIHATGLLVGALFFLPNLRAADQTPAASTKADAFPIFDNYLILGGQNAWVSKDKDAFQARTDSAKGASGGVEDFNYEKDLSKDVSVTADGHAIGGNEDYLAHFNITKTDVGSVDAGYKRFRTYYDGVGGFFPTNNAWMPLPTEDLHVDRSKFWVESTVNLPNEPVFTVSYTNELRDGRKDTTIWGETDLTGIAAYSNATGQPVTKRFVVPSYIDLGERHQDIQALMKHTIGKTTVELSVNEDLVDNLDTRFLNWYPGEEKPYPAIPAAPVVHIASVLANNAETGFDQQGNKSNTFSAMGKVETVFNDKISFHAGLRFQHLTSEFTGNRLLYIETATAKGTEVAPTDQVLGLLGGSKVLDYTATTGVDLKPIRDLMIQLDLKGDNKYTKGADSYLAGGAATVNTATGVVAPGTLTLNHAGETVEDPSWTPEINARYNGIRGLSLYTSANFRYVSGTERVVASYSTTPATQDEDTHENHGSYSVGANWVACSSVSLRGETFYKDHQNNFQDYANFPSAVPIQYVLGYQVYGFKLTAIVNPISTVTLTTRYILQNGKMETASNIVSAAILPEEYDSMNAHNQQIDETIDWTPMKQFYMQGNINVVFDCTSTSYPASGYPNADNLVQNANNNYWEGSVLAGYVIDAKTDGQAEFTYYRADNYNPALVETVSYGAGEEDYRYTVGAKRKITEKLIASAKVGYLVSQNNTSGGFTNYHAVVAYVALDRAF